MNSLPLSTWIRAGTPRCLLTSCTTSTTRSPLMLKSTWTARHSRVQVSISVSARNRFPLNSASETKSIAHTSLGCPAPGCAARRAALTCRLGRWIRKFSPASWYSLKNRLWLMCHPPAPSARGFCDIRTAPACGQSRSSFSGSVVPLDGRCPGSGKWSATRSERRRRAVRSPGTPSAGDRPGRGAGPASELFLNHVLQHDLVQAQIGHQLLQLAVFLFKLSETA